MHDYVGILKAYVIIRHHWFTHVLDMLTSFLWGVRGVVLTWQWTERVQSCCLRQLNPIKFKAHLSSVPPMPFIYCRVWKLSTSCWNKHDLRKRCFYAIWISQSLLVMCGIGAFKAHSIKWQFGIEAKKDTNSSDENLELIAQPNVGRTKWPKLPSCAKCTLDS